MAARRSSSSVTRRSSTPGELVGPVEGKSALADQLGVSAARRVRRGETAGERLEQRVRARVVEARGQVDVLRSQELGKLAPRARGRRVRTRSKVTGARPTNVSS